MVPSKLDESDDMLRDVGGGGGKSRRIVPIKSGGADAWQRDASVCDSEARGGDASSGATVASFGDAGGEGVSDGGGGGEGGGVSLGARTVDAAEVDWSRSSTGGRARA